MSRVLKDYKPPVKGPGRPDKYPYDDWFDGKIREVVSGKDYDCKSTTIYWCLKRAARVRGLSIQVYETNQSRVVFQCPAS